jgi:hypothetical protein
MRSSDQSEPESQTILPFFSDTAVSPLKVRKTVSGTCWPLRSTFRYNGVAALRAG